MVSARRLVALKGHISVLISSKCFSYKKISSADMFKEPNVAYHSLNFIRWGWLFSTQHINTAISCSSGKFSYCLW